jgi:hypothetical protein
MNKHIQHAAWLGALLLAAGCNSSDSSDQSGGSEMDDVAKMLDQPKPVAQTQPTPPPKPSEPVKHNVEHTDTSNWTGGYLGAVGAARRSMRNRIDDWAWKQAVQHYQATNGYLPRNTEEFMQAMREIDIPLPEIGEGNQYEYDPSEGQFGTLYEVTPAQPETPAQ